MKVGALVLALATVAASGQAQTLDLGDLACLPQERHATAEALAGELPAGSEVRLYFRRLHPLGSFYFQRMMPDGGGAYWGVLPRPEPREQRQLTDEWWQVLETRDWMRGRDRAWLEDWLESHEREAAEVYATIHDANGILLLRTPVQLVEVVAPEDCEQSLDPRQWGWAHNLTVGETTELQRDSPVFHWRCDGIVTRLSHEGILYPDEFCRDCVPPGEGEHYAASESSPSDS